MPELRAIDGGEGSRSDFAVTVGNRLGRLIDDVFRLELDRNADPEIVRIRRELEQLGDEFVEYDNAAEAESDALTGALLDCDRQAVRILEFISKMPEKSLPDPVIEIRTAARKIRDAEEVVYR